MTQHDIQKLKTFHTRCLGDIAGVTLWDKRRNMDIFKVTGEIPIVEQLKQNYSSGCDMYNACQANPKE